jgi:broad specificity phosphatase PhoE
MLIVRHGESEWNRAGRWQGWEDIALTPLGEAQARARGAQLAGSGHRFAAVHSSDLRRAARTAALLAHSLGAGPAVADRGLRERFGGEWQGRTGKEIDAQWPGVRDAWRRGELAAPPGGEADTVVLERIHAALERIHTTNPPGPVLVVTHHGVVRLLSIHSGIAVTELIPNLGGRWFEYDASGLRAGDALTPLAPLAPASEVTTE